MVAAITARARGGTGQRLDVSQLMALAWLERWAVETLLVRGLDEWPRFDRENTRNPLFSHYPLRRRRMDHPGDRRPRARLGSVLRGDGAGMDARGRALQHGRGAHRQRPGRWCKRSTGASRRSRGPTGRSGWGPQRALVFDRVQRIRDLPQDPAVQANAYLQDVEHPRHGPVKMLTHPTLLTKTPAAYYRPAPELGQHTDERAARAAGLRRRPDRGAARRGRDPLGSATSCGTWSRTGSRTSSSSVGWRPATASS